MSNGIRNEGKSITIVQFLWMSSQIIGRIQHYISRKAILKDLVEKQGLFNNDLVHNYADLYKLTVEQILPLERMAQNLPITW
jgi:DNA ligase (NAD+)